MNPGESTAEINKKNAPELITFLMFLYLKKLNIRNTMQINKNNLVKSGNILYVCSTRKLALYAKPSNLTKKSSEKKMSSSGKIIRTNTKKALLIILMLTM